MKTLFDFINEKGINYFTANRNDIVLNNGDCVVDFAKNSTYDEFENFKKQAIESKHVFLQSYCIYTKMKSGERELYYPNEIFILI